MSPATWWSPARAARVVARVERRGGSVPSSLLLALDAHRWPEPSFGGVEDDPDRRWDRRLARLQVRAMLFANPDTPCSSEEVAAVLGLRQGTVRDARPTTARSMGRALVAPFGHWVVALRRAAVPPSWPTELDDGLDRPLAPRTHARAPRLLPLGGPTCRGRG